MGYLYPSAIFQEDCEHNNKMERNANSLIQIRLVVWERTLMIENYSRL